MTDSRARSALFSPMNFCPLAFLMLCLSAWAQPVRVNFAKGADLSLLPFLLDHGVVYREAGQVQDPLLILKNHGGNYVRLRLFLAPNGLEGQVNTLSYTLKLAQRVKVAGLKFLLDLHYSDGWADPVHQIIPAEWTSLSHTQLVERVYAYTRETLAAFRREGCSPDMVEVGNEITNGLLWPDGGPFGEPAKGKEADNRPSAEVQWDRLADLLKAGIRGVQADDRRREIPIMLHIDKGGSRETGRWFFDQIAERGVPFDVIGLSHYPFWNGSFSDLKTNLASLSETYRKPIIVVETSYDNGGGDQKKLPYPLTPAGQKAYLEALIQVVAATPEGRGQGVFYWAPEWIQGRQWQAPEWSGQWENRALFDRAGNSLPGWRAFEIKVTSGGDQASP